MKAVVAAFNQEKALVGAFSVITNLRMELFEALVPRLLAITKALDYRGETVWWARRGTLKLVLGLCWLLALLPAVPMWPGVGDTRRDFNDGSGIYCGFPYGSVRGTFPYYFVTVSRLFSLWPLFFLFLPLYRVCFVF